MTDSFLFHSNQLNSTCQWLSMAVQPGQTVGSPSAHHTIGFLSIALVHLIFVQSLLVDGHLHSICPHPVPVKMHLCESRNSGYAAHWCIYSPWGSTWPWWVLNNIYRANQKWMLARESSSWQRNEDEGERWRWEHTSREGPEKQPNRPAVLAQQGCHSRQVNRPHPTCVVHRRQRAQMDLDKLLLLTQQAA